MCQDKLTAITLPGPAAVTAGVFQVPPPGPRYNPTSKPFRVFIDTNNQSRHAVTDKNNNHREQSP